VDIIVKVKSKADQSVQNIRHSVNGRMVLGRGPDCAVPLDTPGISREHLEVQVEDSALVLTDLSSNGSWLNGARMPQHRKCKARENDLVELPGYEIQFQLATVSPASAKPAGLPMVSPVNARRASAGSGGGVRSLAVSFAGLELFLLTVVLASAALLVFYLTA